MDIHKGLGNANILLSRILLAGREAAAFYLSEFQGGNLRNAIPREGHARVVVPDENYQALVAAVEAERAAIQSEYGSLEPGLEVSIKEDPLPERAMGPEDTSTFLQCLYCIHNGVYAMSHQFPGLVETSNNLARVDTRQGRIEVGCLTRSSRDSAKKDLVRKLRAAFTLAGYSVETGGDYPGWLPDPGSEILELLSNRYKELFGSAPEVIAGHGGLECGILKDHYPQMDMISFGPTIHGAHSPDERASVTSVRKFWKLLLDVLAHIPE
jgi:dipeptidase D